MANKILQLVAGGVLGLLAIALIIGLLPGFDFQPPTRTAHIVYQTQLTPQQQAFHNKLEAILADDLNIQAGRDSITYFVDHHTKPWDDSTERSYEAITGNLTALFAIRSTLIAQYNALSEAPSTSTDREPCLPRSIDPLEDISYEIGLINQYCA